MSIDQILAKAANADNYLKDDANNHSSNDKNHLHHD
nr:MAG TPA: hypothetical protein [Caudoviricetes sp.]